MTPADRAYVFDFDAPPVVDAVELRQLLGGKGANLVTMANELALPVPPGFVITTEACISFLDGQWPAGLDDELRDHLDRLAARVGRRFGDRRRSPPGECSLGRAGFDAGDDGHDPEPGAERGAG